MILICYDGSAGATRAIEQAAHLMPGHPATVLSIRQPRLGSKEIGAAGDAIGSQQTASRLAAAGAELAHEAGIDASSAGVVTHSSIAATVLGEAERLHADAIVIGSRAQDGERRAPLGSLGRTVVQLANRPVLIVPPPS